jgi:hypothetical protein
MKIANLFHQKSKNVLSALFVVICIGTVVLYWVMAPESLYHTLGAFMLSYLVLWSVIFLWNDTSNTEKVKRFFLTTGSFALTIGFFELLVAVQAIDFRIIFETPVVEPWHHPANLKDPKLLHIHKPYDRWLWYGIEYQYDQYGLRNDTDLESADLIVIGDSFVEGLGVSAKDILTTQLAEQLNRSVANIAQSWYGPNQELELLRRYGLKFDPKICVWVFYEGNDLADLQRYTMATRDWESFSKDFHSFRQRSFMKNAILAIRRMLPPIPNKNMFDRDRMKEQSGLYKSSSGQMIRLYFHDKGYYLSEDDRIAIKELSSVLGQAHQLCHAVGAKFFFVFAPTKFRVYRDFTEFSAEAQPRYWVINDLPQKLEAMVLENFPDGKFLDLTTALVDQARQEPLLYFNYDTHWSAEGHRIAASAIANIVRQWE